MRNRPMVWMALMAGLTGCDWLGSTAARVIPALEVVDPSFAAEPVDCSAPIPTPRPNNNGVISTLTCGDVVEGYTGVGTRQWGDSFYRSVYCTPEVHYYDNAREAVYALKVPPNFKATIQLDSNCADLDVVAVAWEETGHMPTDRHPIIECEMDTSRGGGTIAVTTVSREQRYLIGVDGKNNAESNFRLSVTCAQYR
ncbi:MAG: hypothetical protein AAFV53_01680 [Myxococcota bacterium]